MNVFDLTGKVAVVTGSAGGLGQAMAIGLAEAGADVALVSHSHSSSDTMQAIEQLGRKALAVTADLSDDAQIEQVIQETLQHFGKINILLNNAGIIRRAPAAEHAKEDWDEVLQINLNAVFRLCQLAGREMIKMGYGKIINIASMLSFQGGVNVPGYTASKHGVAGITKALANEWAGKGVHVNAIAPGYMVTDNTAALRKDEARNKQIIERIPAGRWGVPEDLKGPVVFLASSASDYLDGHVLCVDGGWMAR